MTAIVLPGSSPDKQKPLQEALEHYATQYCEGWCKACPETAGPFEDCGGCLARVALAAGKSQAPSESAKPTEGTLMGSKPAPLWSEP